LSEQDLSLALNFLGVEAGSRDDVRLAQSLFEESLEIRQRLGDHWGIAQCLLNLGGTASFLGDQEKARAYYEEALAAAYTSGEPSRISLPLAGLGYLAAEIGDDAQACKYFRQVLTVCRMFRFSWMSAEILAQMGNIESRQTNMERAARLWGASQAIYKAHGASDFQLQEAENQIRTARERLGELVFSKAWSEGQSMTLEQAIEYALYESNS
jgi:tetratricopeptide (TPR) repeat protein